MTEEIQHPTFAQKWKANKIVKKAKKMAIKQLKKEGVPESTARHLVKNAAKRMAQKKSNEGVQEPSSDIQ